jgi:hypothetical protein
MLDIDAILSGLAKRRPLFHSEADFKHGLAWEIQQRFPESSVRLEYKPKSVGKRIYLDVWVTDQDRIYAIELKYKTRNLRGCFQGEDFDLLDQSAQDCGRYDFLTDVERLERLVSPRRSAVGYAVFLTNDSAYWLRPRSETTNDRCFRIHEGRTLAGELRWGAGASFGTMDKRENVISLHGQYQVHWRDYSQPSSDSYGKLRYTCLEIRVT